MSELLSLVHISARINECLPNYKAVDLTESELYILEVEKSDACIRPFLLIHLPSSTSTNICYHAS